MKGAILKERGALYEVVNNIERPKPGAHQILVKSIATAINPVYAWLPMPSLKDLRSKEFTSETNQILFFLKRFVHDTRDISL